MYSKFLSACFEIHPYVSALRSFSLPSSSLLYEYATIFLTFHLLGEKLMTMGCFQFLAIINKVAMNLLCKTFCGPMF